MENPNFFSKKNLFMHEKIHEKNLKAKIFLILILLKLLSKSGMNPDHHHFLKMHDQLINDLVGSHWIQPDPHLILNPMYLN